MTNSETIFNKHFTPGAPTNVKVNFYAGSYQYAEPRFYTIDSLFDFGDMLRFTNNHLKYGKKNSTPGAQKDTFWATFTIEGESLDIFESRISI